MEIKKQISEKILFHPCKIKPLENYSGVIVSVCANQKGFEYQVRYYFDGSQRTEWFYDFEIEVIK